MDNVLLSILLVLLGAGVGGATTGCAGGGGNSALEAEADGHRDGSSEVEENAPTEPGLEGGSDADGLNEAKTESNSDASGEGDAGGDADWVADGTSEATSESDRTDSLCGNHELDGNEKCDGDTVACTSLDSTLFAGGEATCNGTCTGYNVKTCTFRSSLTFEKAFGGAEYDDGKDILATDDGGYLATGYSQSFVNVQPDPNAPDFLVSNRDLLLVKLDASGQEIWHKNYGEKYPDSGDSILAAGDGGYLVAGTTTVVLGKVVQDNQLLDKIRSDAWLLKIDESGVVLWQKRYGEPESEEEFSQIIPTSDGNFLAVGKVAIHNADQSNEPFIGLPSQSTSRLAGYAVKMSPQGEALWTRTFGGPNAKWDFTRGVTELANGYVAVGGTSSFDSGTLDFSNPEPRLPLTSIFSRPTPQT